MKYRHGSAHTIVVVVLVVVLAASLGYLAWQAYAESNSDTPANDPAYDGWATYTSTAGADYTIRYPEDWQVSSTTGDGGIYLSNISVEEATNDDGEYVDSYRYIRILTEENDENFVNSHEEREPSEWYADLGEQDLAVGSIRYPASDVVSTQLNGQDAKSARAIGFETTEDLVLTRDNTLYTLSVYPYGSADETTLRAILNSMSI